MQEITGDIGGALVACYGSLFQNKALGKTIVALFMPRFQDEYGKQSDSLRDA